MPSSTFSEITIPLLPSHSIAQTIPFYQALGFQVTYQQQRPNVYAVVKLRGIELHFFVLKALQPANNYSTCYVLVEEIDALYESFKSGIHTLLGKLPVRGVPRVNPLKNIPAYGVRQFIIVDPSGNYIRVGQPIEKTPSLVYPESELAPLKEASPLEKALELASRLADGKGDFLAAATTLDKALKGNELASLATLRALVLRADLAIRLQEPSLAETLLVKAEAMAPRIPEQNQLGEEWRLIHELSTLLE